MGHGKKHEKNNRKRGPSLLKGCRGSSLGHLLMFCVDMRGSARATHKHKKMGLFELTLKAL